MIKSSSSKAKIITYNIMNKQKEETHFHQDVEFIYVLEGEMDLKIEGDTFYLKQYDDVVVEMTSSEILAAYSFWLQHPYDVDISGVNKIIIHTIRALDYNAQN